MSRIDPSERAKRKAEAAAAAVRIQRAKDEARRVVATGHCPECGEVLRRNLSITGWWQCAQVGSVVFRKDPSKPSCNWQAFTE
jgi:ribosomal protein L37AE/L43A